VRQRVGQRRLGGDVAELDAERHDRLRHLRPDAADDALGPEQTRRAHRLEQMLGHLGVHRGHPGDVQHGVIRAGRDQGLQQLLHDQLSAR